MCGIAGYISSKKISPRILPRMIDRIRHRGPDSDGFFTQGNFSGGMCRLKINDLHNGDQPLYNEDQTVVVFYNGEIYNSPALRKNLKGKGHQLRTNSDGEVIAHLYEEYGEQLFSHLDGMFAIALWDTTRKCLFLARDLPGEKPLYYAKLPNQEIVYASEIKALQEFPGLDLSLNYQALWDYPTFLWIPDPSTAYEGIYSLPRGHYLSVDERGIESKSYPNNFDSPLVIDSDKSAINETRRIVEQAVSSRLLSDVPLGSFLSGGLDSSIVSYIARQHCSNLTTFCIGFEDLEDPYHGKSNEAHHAESFARTIEANTTTFMLTEKISETAYLILSVMRISHLPYPRVWVCWQYPSKLKV